MSYLLQPSRLQRWYTDLPGTDSGLPQPERPSKRRARLEVPECIGLEHGVRLYMNMERRGNEVERGYKVMYPLMNAARQRIAEEFGERLRTLRKRSGLSLRTLGEEIGCAHSTLDKWEKGQTVNFDYLILTRLALRLGTTPKSLMFGDGEDPWVLERLAAPPSRKRSP